MSFVSEGRAQTCDPERVAGNDLGFGQAHVAVEGNIAVATSSQANFGVSIIDISDPMSPTVLTQMTEDSGIGGVLIQDGIAYVVDVDRVDGTNFVSVRSIDLSNPSVPTVIDTELATMNGYVTTGSDIALNGSYLSVREPGGMSWFELGGSGIINAISRYPFFPEERGLEAGLVSFRDGFVRTVHNTSGGRELRYFRYDEFGSEVVEDETFITDVAVQTIGASGDRVFVAYSNRMFEEYELVGSELMYVRSALLSKDASSLNQIKIEGDVAMISGSVDILVLSIDPLSPIAEMASIKTLPGHLNGSQTTGLDYADGFAYLVGHRSFDVVNVDSCVAVSCFADFNDDGNLNFLDISAFLAAFGKQNPIADFEPDGNFNFLDVSAYLAAFAAGCP